MSVLTSEEVKEITDDWEKIAQDRLRKRIEEGKTRSVGQLDVDLDEERADAADPDKLVEMQETLDELRRQLDIAEGGADPETDTQSDIENRDHIRRRIEEIESAIDIYGPRA